MPSKAKDETTLLVKDIASTFEPHHNGKSREELSQVLDQEVERFSKYMETVSDWRAKGALSPPEKALIKSYLVAKLSGKLDEA